MSLNKLIVQLALEKLNQFKKDTDLYDAIVEMDIRTILYLVNNKYKLEILNRGVVREPVSTRILISELESNLQIR